MILSLGLVVNDSELPWSRIIGLPPMAVPLQPMRKNKLGTIGNQMLHVFAERPFYSTSTIFSARISPYYSNSFIIVKHNATQDSQLTMLISLHFCFSHIRIIPANSNCVVSHCGLLECVFRGLYCEKSICKMSGLPRPKNQTLWLSSVWPALSNPELILLTWIMQAKSVVSSAFKRQRPFCHRQSVDYYSHFYPSSLQMKPADEP